MGIERRIGKNGQVSWRVRVRMKGHPIQTETLDRKTDAAQWAESVLSSASPRSLTVSGQCGIPATAKSIARSRRRLGRLMVVVQARAVRGEV